MRLVQEVNNRKEEVGRGKGQVVLVTGEGRKDALNPHSFLLDPLDCVLSCSAIYEMTALRD